jgi:hypothetical protein
MPRLNKKSLQGALCGDIAILGKVAHLGDVDFRVKGQSAIHGTVALHAKWLALGTMPSLAKLHCKHHNYHVGVIAGCAGVVTFGTSHCSQHCTGILTLLQWRVAIVAVASLPL